MADTLNEQGAQASAEATRIEERLAPTKAEITRLDTAARQLNELAQKIAPMEK
jgi:hypothetical protein